ncbi:cupin domain-containing protein [Runella aurantiaca]|uniref:Cupin domain-containing protein n=1 Tax=Runella aurantiaca TaxID=2282308 RepID=A0A369IC13_9BACT|nr:cupin domain-containing protein [Runella aurantiaca]RDB05987.1 cupin domain-containing protein [Runella aurantiaca]
MAAVPFLNIPFKERTDKAFVVETNKTRFNENLGGGSRNDLKVSGKDTDGQLAIFEIHTKGNAGPALHIHQDQDEIVTVIESDYLFQIGDEKIKLKAGDTLFIPRGTPHAFVHLGQNTTGRKLSTYQPAGNIEEMFRQIGNLKERTPENIQKAMVVNNSKIVGSPLKVE